jgi:deoxyribose-phosphate aldolase
VEDISLMREVLPSTVGIKASGGIKTLEQALALIQAGADRLGTSAAKSLMDEWTKENA